MLWGVSLSVGKISFLGLAGAGKTSIYNKCFLSEPSEKALTTSPTVLFKLSKPTIKIFGKEFQLVVFDLGGQESYLSSHLANNAIFKNLSAAIFVIDVGINELFEKAILFLGNSLERIYSLNHEFPIVAIFLHKFDPVRQSKLEPLAQEVKGIICEKLPELKDYIYRTSLLDESVNEAMNDVLYKALEQFSPSK